MTRKHKKSKQKINSKLSSFDEQKNQNSQSLTSTDTHDAHTSKLTKDMEFTQNNTQCAFTTYAFLQTVLENAKRLSQDSTEYITSFNGHIKNNDTQSAVELATDFNKKLNFMCNNVVNCTEVAFQSFDKYISDNSISNTATVTSVATQTDSNPSNHNFNSSLTNDIDDSNTQINKVKIILCYRCSFYGHLAISCRNKISCPVCAGKHSDKNCNKKPKCVNCIRFNKTMNLNLNINHPAFATNCPARKIYLKSKFEESSL